MPKQRLTPDKLLQLAQEEERQEQSAKLKIYLGAAPGVGKTFAMLRDAQVKRTQGLDVVVGIIESHGRQDTQALCQQFEILPRLPIEYKQQTLLEFDLDGALNRHPGLILVDEMAHTNVPGSRHAKRWQDIKELLDRGIDVWTTLNVQHIESLNDIVSQIIHTQIKESVPDFMLELASTIELIDLPPEELLKRLQEGKVYFPAQAELAKEHFFRKGNLIALREIALRFTAERVGTQVLMYRQGLGIRHIWPTKEKILVCIGPAGDSTKLIRTARRLAANSQTEWMAVYVDTPRLMLSEEQRNHAIQNLRLAEQLGASTRILTGFDIVKEVINFAREENISLLVVGKKIRSRWRDLIFTNIADDIVRHSEEIEVYIVTGEAVPTKRSRLFSFHAPKAWKSYGIAIGTVALITVINVLLKPYVDTSNLLMAYLLGVILVALLGQIGPATLASILSVLAYGYFFILPTFSLTLSYLQYFFTLFVMLLITQVISQLMILIKRQVENAQLAERRAAALHALSHQLASTRGSDKLLEIAVRYFATTFESRVLALIAQDGKLVIKAKSNPDAVLNAKEQSVAQWVFDLGQVAGLGTDTLPFSEALYIPLLSSKEPIGVLRLQPLQSQYHYTPEQMHLFENCANQIALALEVDRLQESKKAETPIEETDQVRNALLQAVSHDLRTPLIAIMGAARTQIEMADTLDVNKIKHLGEDIFLESEHLNRLINNLLQITYLEAGSVILQKELYSLNDVVILAMNNAYKKLVNRQVNLNMPADLPLIPIDNTLLQEVLVNLLDNAIKFSDKDEPIDISARVENNYVVVSIADYGPGIAPDEVKKLFEKFYRGRLITTERGLGLGLAICQNIIKAHGGKIWAENHAKGAVFHFTLPLRHIGELKNA